jgi:hypothetical protein
MILTIEELGKIIVVILVEMSVKHQKIKIADVIEQGSQNIIAEGLG